MSVAGKACPFWAQTFWAAALSHPLVAVMVFQPAKMRGNTSSQGATKSLMCSSKNIPFVVNVALTEYSLQQLFVYLS